MAKVVENVIFQHLWLTKKIELGFACQITSTLRVSQVLLRDIVETIHIIHILSKLRIVIAMTANGARFSDDETRFRQQFILSTY